MFFLQHSATGEHGVHSAQSLTCLLVTLLFSCMIGCGGASEKWLFDVFSIPKKKNGYLCLPGNDVP